MKTNKCRQSVRLLLLTVLLLFGVGMLIPMTLSVSAATAAVQDTVSLSASSITKGQSVTIYGSKNPDGSERYAYYVKKASAEKWSTIKGFSTAASVKYTPASAVNYDVKVIIKSADGTKRQYLRSLTVKPALVNTSTVSKKEIALGNQVTIKGAAKGGSAPYVYAYYWKLSAATSWVRLADYGSITSVTFKPGYAAAYDIMVKVMDSNDMIISKTLTLNVYPKLVNQSTVTPLEVQKGAEVQMSGAAEGGSGDYTYSYSYKNSTATQWTLLQTYSKVRTANCTMNQTGNISILIKVKDSLGNVASKTFTVKVAEPTVNGKADEILAQIIKPNMTEFDKVRAIHDWLVKNVSYDERTYTESGAPQSSYTAEGLFQTHVAVCDGYSKAFVVMAERAGLQAVRVTGVAASTHGTQSHAWNQVKVDGKWYNIDVTWDDPVVSETYGDNLTYIYFMIPDSVIEIDHVAYSSKNTCTAAQPTERLYQILLAEEKKNCPNTLVYCEDETALAKAVHAINGDVSGTTTFICHTDLSNGKIFDIVKQNKPSTTVGYGIRMNAKGWKLKGYIYLNVILTTK